MHKVVGSMDLAVDARDVEWEELPLRGVPDGGAIWPAIHSVHVVSAGGVDNAGVEHNRAPIALAVFTDLPSAEAFAASERATDPTVVVRSVALGTPLIQSA